MQKEFDKKKFIEERIKNEEEFARSEKEDIRGAVLEYLKNNKGYSDEDIEIDRKFNIQLDGKNETCCVDFLIRHQDKPLMAIKCTPTYLESRERHILAFSRVVDSHQIPISVVTNSIQARVIDTASGSLISEDINSIPSKDGLNVQGITFKKCPEARLEKEKRILLAFESISCSIIY